MDTTEKNLPPAHTPEAGALVLRALRSMTRATPAPHYQPTAAEIADALGAHPSWVQHALTSLSAAGRIERIGSRAIVVRPPE